MKRLTRLALLSALSLATACDFSEREIPLRTLDGAYIGTVGPHTLRMTLVDRSGVVTGVGTITNTNYGDANGVRALTISGTYVPPNLSLILSTPQVASLGLTATGSPTRFNATLSGYEMPTTAFPLDGQ